MKLEPITAYKGGTKTKKTAQGMSMEHVHSRLQKQNFLEKHVHEIGVG